MSIKIARGRVEIHHGPPHFFDDHFEKGWIKDSASNSTMTTDGEILTLASGNQSAGLANKALTSWSTDMYQYLAMRIKSVADGTYGIDFYYDGGWNNVITGYDTLGLVNLYLPSGLSVTNIRIRSEGAGCILEVDYISLNKTSAVIPLDPPGTMDILGEISISSRINKCSTASFIINNTPTNFNATGPYNSKLENKDIVIIWAYRSDETLDESDKLFGGIITNLGNKGQNTATHLIPIECMDHGWEMNKPPTLFNEIYAATGGKKILTDATNLCSYLSGAFIDVDGDCASTHDVDYSEQGEETTPMKVFEELTVKMQTNTGAVGFDWRITPAGVIYCIAKGTVASGLTLDDDDFELLDRDSDWWRCFNSITIYGSSGKYYSDDQDLFTEPDVYASIATQTNGASNAGQNLLNVDDTANLAANMTLFLWSFSTMQEVVEIDSVINATCVQLKTNLVNNWTGFESVLPYLTSIHWGAGSLSALGIDADSTNKTAGNKSVRVTCGMTGGSIYTRLPADIDTTAYPKVEFQLRADADASMYLQLWDSTLKHKYYMLGTVTADNSFHSFSIQKDSPGWVGDIGFDWTNIRLIEICCQTNTYFNLDGLAIGGGRYTGSANNAASIAAWGTLWHEPETDDALTSDAECVLKAKGVLTPLIIPLITYQSLRLQQGQKLNPGETITINSTTPEITDASIIILEVTHTIQGTEWDTNVKLNNDPVEIDYLFRAMKSRIDLALRGL